MPSYRCSTAYSQTFSFKGIVKTAKHEFNVVINHIEVTLRPTACCSINVAIMHMICIHPEKKCVGT